jgi:hypothetical protein
LIELYGCFIEVKLNLYGRPSIYTYIKIYQINEKRIWVIKDYFPHLKSLFFTVYILTGIQQYHKTNKCELIHFK